MQVFNIDKKLLKAAAYAAATDDPRPINGVYLDKKALGLKFPMFKPVYLSNQINETDFKAFKFEFLNCQVYIMPVNPDIDYR